MTDEPRRCLFCGKPLTDRRPQTKFCNDSCRAAGYRVKESAVLGILREIAGRPPLRGDLDLPGRGTWTGQLREAELTALAADLSDGATAYDRIRARRPGTVALFGEAVIRAACAPATRGVCRGCIARQWASVHGADTPTFDRPTLRLLCGEVCQECLEAERDALLDRGKLGRRSPAGLTR
jgi:hypothetical protein